LAILICLGLVLAPSMLAQHGGEPNGDVGEHEEDDHHNETHEEEYHDPWMNLYITGGVIIAFMVAVVVWPRK